MKTEMVIVKDSRPEERDAGRVAGPTGVVYAVVTSTGLLHMTRGTGWNPEAGCYPEDAKELLSFKRYTSPGKREMKFTPPSAKVAAAPQRAPVAPSRNDPFPVAEPFPPAADEAPVEEEEEELSDTMTAGDLDKLSIKKIHELAVTLGIELTPTQLRLSKPKLIEHMTQFLANEE